MPDLRGMSAREILRWSESEGVEVRIKGSGFADSHVPMPGESIKEGMVCMIELKQSI